jgi:rhamnose transport system permease protein
VAVFFLDPSFLRWKVQLKLSENLWEMAILALPMTCIILTAGIDLSIGSTMALATIVFGTLWSAGVPVPVAGAAAVVAGTAGGLTNGVLIARLKVHPLIVTLATLAAYRGIAEGISKGMPVSPLPGSFTALLGGRLCGLPVSLIVFAVLAGVFGVVLARTPYGRYIRATGFGETAARFSGVPVDRLYLWLYGCAGFCAGLAALLYAARRNTATPAAGENLELEVITAVVIGGTSIYGGRGTIAGTCLGLLTIHEAREFVKWRWSSDELNLIVIGSLLVASVLVQRVFTARSRS